MAYKSTGTIHDAPAITTAGNREERDAQIERVRARHERLHPVDATVDEFGESADARPDSRSQTDDEFH